MLKRNGGRPAKGFTIVELLIVVVIIGILAAIVVVAYNGITTRANEAKASADLSNIEKAITRLEIDTNGTVFNCPGGGTHYGPEGALNSAVTGLVSAPTDGAVNESCTWTTAAVNNWKGPYIQTLLDPWGRVYRIDLDYFVCEGGTAQLIAAILSMGPDGGLQYPSSTTSGACTTTTSDDIYEELWRT